MGQPQTGGRLVQVAGVARDDAQGGDLGRRERARLVSGGPCAVRLGEATRRDVELSDRVDRVLDHDALDVVGRPSGERRHDERDNLVVAG